MRTDPAAASPRRTARLARRAAAFTFALGVLLGGLRPAPVVAQGLGELASACGAGTDLAGLCAPAVTSLLGFADGLATVQTRGSHLPGSSSTLGKRFATSPRVSVTGAIGFTQAQTAFFPDEGGFGTATASLLAADATVAVGVTEGFSPQPTVGGVLSVDLLARIGQTLVYDDLSEGNAGYFGYGLRVGLLRESFTLPGVTLSAMRVHSGGVARPLSPVGGTSSPPTPAGSTRIEDVVTTSLRAVAGKEFAAFGFSGGIGWDRVEVDGDFQVAATSEFIPVPEAIGVEGLRNDRFSAFVGLSSTVLIATVFVDGGWVRGLDVPDRFEFPGGTVPFDVGEWDPTGGRFWASVGTRLTF